VVAVAGHDIIKPPAGRGGARVRCLPLERLDIGGRVRVIERLEVLAAWSGSYGNAMPVSAGWMRNHQRSTSVMCRTRPSGDSREGEPPAP